MLTTKERIELAAMRSGEVDRYAFNEADHPRGQPNNAGQFVKGQGVKVGKSVGSKIKGGDATVVSGPHKISGVSGHYLVEQNGVQEHHHESRLKASGKKPMPQPATVNKASSDVTDRINHAVATHGEQKPPVTDKPQAGFFTPQEASVETQKQPIPPNAGYQALAAKGSQANLELQQFLDFGKGIGSQLGYETILPGSMTDEQLTERLKQPGGIVQLAPVKGEKRSSEKVAADYGGDWSKLLDIARATIAVDSVDDIHNVINKLRSSGIKFAKPPKDRMSKPADASGYRDILTNVVMPNGVVAELQIHLKPMLIAKQQGHHEYETMRSIEGKMKLEGRDKMTPEETAAHQSALAKAQKIYGDAWKRASGGKKA